MRAVLHGGSRNFFAMPELLLDRCTHFRSPHASCDACVDSCPREALQFTAGQVQLDAAACDACGLCVAVCPEGALAARISRPLHDPGHVRAFVACEPAVEACGEGILPCLHAMLDQQVVALARAGVRTLETAHLDCASCPRRPGDASRLETRLADFNAACRQRGLAGISLERIGITEWKKRTVDLRVASSRRGFLGNLFTRPAAALLSPGGNAASSRDARAMGIWLATQGNNVLPAVPAVDLRRCTLCGACVAVCNHRALSIQDFGDTARFTIAARQCTGCQLCLDVCRDDAVSIQKWHEPIAHEFTLFRRRCKQCSHGFWEFSETEEKAVCCPVCIQSAGQRPNRIIEG